MAKSFFYRINAAELFAVVRELSDKQCAKWLRTFASDLVAGSTSDEYTKTLIAEADKFRESKSLAGKKGMTSRYQSPNSVITELQQKPNRDITNMVITNSSNNNSNNTKEVLQKHCPKNHSDFEIFWEVFAYKQGKGGAEKAWSSIRNYSPALLEKIIEGARREAERRPALLAQNRTPKMAQGWISERRWEDDITPIAAEVITSRRRTYADDKEARAQEQNDKFIKEMMEELQSARIGTTDIG